MRYRFQLGFCDVDYARQLFSGDYYQWVERALEQWQRDEGIPWKRMIHDLNLGLPTLETRCHHLASIGFEDEFEIGLNLRDLTNRGFVTDFEIIRLKDDRLAAYGYLARRFLDMTTHRGENNPAREAIEVYERMQETSKDFPTYDERHAAVEAERQARREVAAGGKG